MSLENEQSIPEKKVQEVCSLSKEAIWRTQSKQKVTWTKKNPQKKNPNNEADPKVKRPNGAACKLWSDSSQAAGHGEEEPEPHSIYNYCWHGEQNLEDGLSVPEKSRKKKIFQSKLNRGTFHTPTGPLSVLRLRYSYRWIIHTDKTSSEGLDTLRPSNTITTFYVYFPSYKEKRGVRMLGERWMTLGFGRFSCSLLHWKALMVANRLYSTQAVSFIQLAPW